MRQRASPASRLPFGGCAGLDPGSPLSRAREQAGSGDPIQESELIFDERC